MSRPLHSSEGLLLYKLQGATPGTFDSSVTPDQPVGVAEYNVTDDGDFRQFFTVGKKNLHKVIPGIAKVDWQVRQGGLGVVDGKALLQLGLRTSGQVPWHTWAFGSDPVDAASEDWRVMNCKVNGLEFVMDPGGVITATLSGIGGQKTTGSGLAINAGTDDPQMAYASVTTLAGVALENLGIRFSVNHNLEVISVNRGAAVSDAKLRLWDYLIEGNEEISGSVSVPRVYAKDLQAKCPTNDGDIVITITNPCTAATMVITLDDTDIIQQVRNMPMQGRGSFELSFVARGITIT